MNNNYFKNNSRINNCRWLAFLKGIEVLSNKAQALDIDEDKLFQTLNPRKFSHEYIEPVAAEINAISNDNDEFFFI
jgi:hypothetical protein